MAGKFATVQLMFFRWEDRPTVVSLLLMFWEEDTKNTWIVMTIGFDDMRRPAQEKTARQNFARENLKTA